MELPKVDDYIKWYNPHMKIHREGIVTKVDDLGIYGITKGGVKFHIRPPYEKNNIIIQ